MLIIKTYIYWQDVQFLGPDQQEIKETPEVTFPDRQGT